MANCDKKAESPKAICNWLAERMGHRSMTSTEAYLPSKKLTNEAESSVKIRRFTDQLKNMARSYQLNCELIPGLRDHRS